jgi:hypothetical protein
MPISRDEFDAGGSNPEQLLLRLLRDNHETAYTGDELVTLLEDIGVAMSEDALVEILQSLVSKRRVISQVVHERLYYSYDKRIGFLRG